jgi:hypothetical protein
VNEQAQNSIKKAYQPPTVVAHGTVQQITHGGGKLHKDNAVGGKSGFLKRL